MVPNKTNWVSVCLDSLKSQQSLRYKNSDLNVANTVYIFQKNGKLHNNCVYLFYAFFVIDILIHHRKNTRVINDINSLLFKCPSVL